MSLNAQSKSPELETEGVPFQGRIIRYDDFMQVYQAIPQLILRARMDATVIVISVIEKAFLSTKMWSLFEMQPKFGF